MVIAQLGMANIGEYQDYSLGLVNDLGASWVRMDFIFSRTGFFSPKSYLQKIERDGIEIVGCIRSIIPITDVAAYQDGVRQTVRENPNIDSWQIGNEPNVGKLSPSEFAQFFLTTREAVKQKCPDCLIILGGAAVPFDDATTDRPYFDQVFAAIAATAPGQASFDAIDLHIYGIAGKYRTLPLVAGDYRRLLDENGFDPGAVAVWLTECATYTGSPIQPPDYLPQTEELQAAELIKWFTVMTGLGADHVALSRFYENYLYARIDNGYFDNVGLIYNGLGTEAASGIAAGTLKKAFIAYRTLVAQTDGYSTVTQLAPGQYKYEFPDGRTPVYIIWAEDGTGLVAELSGDVEVTDILGSHGKASDIVPEDLPVFVSKPAADN